MFDQDSRDRIRKVMDEIEKKEASSKEDKYNEEEVKGLIESHTLLGCRFGIYLMFQVMHQKGIKDNLRRVCSEELGATPEDLDSDDKLMEILSRKENMETLGENLQGSLMESFINDESASHAQAILIGHANADMEELVCIVHGFSNSIDTYYEEHHKDAPDTLSTSIN
jgi:hypothetical protein